MALAATNEAIGAVSEAVRSQLALRAQMLVTVSRPDIAAASDEEPKLNLFLYQVEFDGHLKNYSLDEGRPAPLWLVLRYLLTAYDQTHDSDSVAAHRLLARGLANLQEINFLSPTVPALADNPEPLKISFESADVELLSKLMQGSDEKYRISVAFQVRPVLIAPDVAPEYAPAVLTVGPPAVEGVTVLPTLGPQLKQVTPSQFEVSTTLELSGDDINTAIDSVLLGSLVLPVTAARDGAVQTQIPAIPALSAGHHVIAVARTLPSGRLMSSNPLLATLRPTLTGASVGALTPNGPNLFGDITLTGQRLGGPDDTIFVAFYRDGAVALNLEVTGIAAQTSLTASVDNAHALPPGTYYLILRVNGAQATHTPQIAWTP
ncbi:DUF4255 domain-containing protein [Nitrosospira sp. NRS527]|uniref:DUF4255 domain-containing protein n=1 Tax=Nitrosospira sp. NRS527 TaxID=155925 RepID=UPI001AF8A0B7|nr:DUF4255 domain-containing protein [Nitrosospira sp. NRS527]BCT67376.1 hypothetical protein NNRS527_00958 [Nitrosospira sp. NRS527]